MKKIIILMILLLACEDAKRVWDNPYAPRSDRSLWTPDTLQATQLSSDKIELSWLRKGRDFDGFTMILRISSDFELLGSPHQN